MSSMEIGLMKTVSVSMYLGRKYQNTGRMGMTIPRSITLLFSRKINKIPCHSQLVKLLNFHLPTGKQLVEERWRYFRVEMIFFFSRMINSLPCVTTSVETSRHSRSGYVEYF